MRWVTLAAFAIVAAAMNFVVRGNASSAPSMSQPLEAAREAAASPRQEDDTPQIDLDNIEDMDAFLSQLPEGVWFERGENGQIVLSLSGTAPQTSWIVKVNGRTVVLGANSKVRMPTASGGDGGLEAPVIEGPSWTYSAPWDNGSWWQNNTGNNNGNGFEQEEQTDASPND